MNKVIITIIIIAIVALGGYFIFNRSPVYQPPNEQTAPQQNKEVMPEPSVAETPTVNKNIITYTDTGYFPNSLTINNGETVTFKNQSSNSMWPASAMHPSHRLYAGTSLDEHCPDKTNSAFDACASILPGGLWSFKFDKNGSWGYHDHLSPKNFGKIIVE